jgi:hypothetical protein
MIALSPRCRRYSTSGLVVIGASALHVPNFFGKFVESRVTVNFVGHGLEIHALILRQ